MGENENIEYYEDGEIASWSDVFHYCYYHMKNNWITVIIHFTMFLGFSYAFFAGIVLLGESMQIIAGCSASNLVESGGNPLSAVMVGFILATLFQSSFVVNNSIIFALVTSGLSVEYGIYMAMGSSIGSTITSSIVALFHITDKNMLERAVAGASVNTIYYLLATAIFFPIERASGMLVRIADAIAPVTPDMNYQWHGLFDTIVSPITNFLIIPNVVRDIYNFPHVFLCIFHNTQSRNLFLPQSVFQNLVSGNIESCTSVYPISCEGDESFSTCATGLVACDSDSDNCPVLFNSGASMKKDQLSGVLGLFISLSVIIVSLYLIVKIINRMLINNPVEVIAKLTTQNHYVIMLMGCGSGMVLVNTSTSESALMPFVATGIFEIEQMFPWCLGSNLGCAITNVLVAWTLGSREYLLVALGNLLFNLFGMILWYPLPYFRECPLHGALVIGIMTRTWRIIGFVHFASTFIGIPFLFLSLGNMINSEKKSTAGFGWSVLIGIALITLYITYSWFYLQGRERFVAIFEDPVDQSNNAGIGNYFGGRETPVEDSYDDSDDEYSDDGSDISSIGFGEAGASKKRKNSKRALNVMRPKAMTPPKARKRLIKNYGETKTDNCGCCAENVLM